jgi:hypothetical protein
VGDSKNNNSVSVCRIVFIPLSLKALKHKYDKHSVTSLKKAEYFADNEVLSATAAQRN